MKLDELEDEIASKCAFENFEKINKHLEKMSNLEGGICNNGIWELKKK